MEILQAILDRNPDNATVLNNVGLLLLRRGDDREAEKTLRKAVALDPGSAAAWTNLAQAAGNLGRYEEAEEAWRKALELKKDDPLLWNNLGTVLAARNRYDEALEAFAAARAGDPLNPAFRANRVSMLVLLGRKDEALEDIRALVAGAAGEADPDLLFEVAGICADLGHYEDAAGAYEKITRIDPADIAAWNGLSVCRGKLKQHDRSIEAAARAVALRPGNAVYLNGYAVSLANAGLKEQSLVHFRRAAEIEPGNAGIHVNLGATLLDLRRYDEARETVEKAVQREPGDIKAWNILRAIGEKQKRYRDALAACEKIVALDPGNDNAWNALGVYLSRLDRHEEALTAQRRAAALGGEVPVYWNNLSVALSNAHRDEEAGDAISRALALDPDDETALRNAAFFYEECGRYGPAYEARKKSMAALLGDAEAQKELGFPDEDGVRARKPAVLSATIDLKLRPDGRIAIFEFNDLWNSGFEGFRRVTGKSMRYDIVQPAYEKIAAQWVAEGRPFREIENAADSRAEPLFHMARAHAFPWPESVHANDDPGFRALCTYKEYLDFSLGESIARYFPLTEVVSMESAADPDAMARRLAGKFGEGPLIVKPLDSCQGKGIEVVPAAEAPARLAALAAQYFGRSDAAGDDPWARNLHPNLIVQECIRGVPVPAESGLLYDGTMRVAFTAVIDPLKEGPPEIHFHGAYWKLPPKDISAGEARDAVVSLPPTALKEHANAAFAGAPVSAAVSGEHRQAVEAQLRDCLAALLPRAVAGPQAFSDRVLAMLDAGESWVRMLGTRLATDAVFGNFMALMCGGAAGEFQEKLARNRALHPDDAAACYWGRITKPYETVATAREYADATEGADYIKRETPAPAP